jgi:starch synthase
VTGFVATRVLHVVSELYPFVKTGGLGDVAAALPPALRAIGVDARILVPGYPPILDVARHRRAILDDPNLFGGGPAHLFEARLGTSGVPTYVLDCPALYARDGGPYQDTRGEDFPDNYRRFAALGWAARWLATARGGDLSPDVVHVHDWQGGLAAAYVKLADGSSSAVVSTIHSIAYPGAFDWSTVGELGLPSQALTMNGVEFFGRVSFLKAALFYADRITTVSPTYAREIQVDGLGGGFEGLLRGRGRELTGILNGVDYSEWDPATDPHLPAPYARGDLGGKAASKEALQRRLGLDVDPKAPLFGIVTRLIWQKGVDWLVEVMPWLVEHGAQLAVLGSGDPEIAAAMMKLVRRHPTRLGALIGYDEGLAHLIQAGSDSVLVPSRTEPCGLTQLYALRYGSPPVVRHTGGLADTVVDATDVAARDGTATGFSFEEPTAGGLKSALSRAIDFYEQKTAWNRLQQVGMAQDFGWERSARQYAELYAELRPNLHPR